MSVIRIVKNSNYVSIHKGFLEDPRISLKLKGFIAYCLSKPDDWVFYVTQLVSVLKEGRDAIYSIIDEGIEFGYIVRSRQRKDQGVFSGCDYCVHEIPKIISTVSGNPDTDNPDTVEPEVENPQLLKNELILKNDNTNITEMSELQNRSSDAPKKLAFSENALELAKYLFSKIQELYPKAKQPNFNSWAKDLDKLLRLDKREVSEVREMIDWIFHDPFWSTNILSPRNLRKQWDRLVMQRIAKKPTPSVPAAPSLEQQNKDYIRDLYIEMQRSESHHVMKIFKDSVLFVDHRETIYFKMAPDEFKRLVNKYLGIDQTVKEPEKRKTVQEIRQKICDMMGLDIKTAWGTDEQ